jgi:isoquinoline 1-oxidoreductase beta subunit
MVAQQIADSIIFGLTSMFNEITYKQGCVQQSNCHDCPILQMSEMPEVEIHVVPSDKAPQGLGEMGVPPIVPAVLNAIFNTSSIRICHMPIHPEDLKNI